MRTEQPPRLQALLRMVQNKLRYIQKLQQGSDSVIPAELQWDQYQDLIQHLMSLADVLGAQISNQNADVRKSVVFCLVEICSVVNDQSVFEREFLGALNQSQQKLVDIYVTRKRQIQER